MKSSNIIKSLAVVLLLGAISFCVFYFASNEVNDKRSKSFIVSVEKEKKKFKSREKANRARIKNALNVDGKLARSLLIDEDELTKLNQEELKLLQEIRRALDENDRKTVVRLVQKMQSFTEWPDGVSRELKKAAIEALGWFGGISSLPELVGFLLDKDEEVSQAALEKFEEALSDFDLSDRERSRILVEASKVITDSDAMDTMLFELSNMRHSVAITTIKQLMEVGGEATKAVLPDNIEFYTGEEGLNTPEKLDEWLQKNPDDEGDEEFYGGTKDE